MMRVWCNTNTSLAATNRFRINAFSVNMLDPYYLLLTNLVGILNIPLVKITPYGISSSGDNIVLIGHVELFLI